MLANVAFQLHSRRDKPDGKSRNVGNDKGAAPGYGELRLRRKEAGVRMRNIKTGKQGNYSIKAEYK